MTNAAISDTLSLLSKLMDINGENSFKTKSYSIAAFTADKFPTPFAQMSEQEIASIKGIGASSAKKIIELIETGKLAALEELVATTPPGVLEMLSIKGIGPSKIHTIWKEMDIETVGELLYACKENRLLHYKGFGSKTQKNIEESIEFYERNKAFHLYATVETFFDEIVENLKSDLPSVNLQVTGDYARRNEFLDSLEFLVDDTPASLAQQFSASKKFKITAIDPNAVLLTHETGIKVKLQFCNPEALAETLVRQTSSPEFYNHLANLANSVSIDKSSEKTYFQSLGLPYTPPHMRESLSVFADGKLENTVTNEHIRSLIHCHSTWSDGADTIEAMANACIELGLEYMVISDHSRSAVYANGLTIERIVDQHKEIDALNVKLAPFKIFKSIESDILNDGNLDYPDEVLASFDLVIASIHSNLKMIEEVATSRLINAVKNKHTTILGHPTGRLLLSRPGYPVNMDALVAACKENDVAIELNANPHRLDIDWRLIEKAVDAGCNISINPDSHAISTINQIKYGVNVAQKALLPFQKNLSSLTLAEFEQFVHTRKLSKGIS